MVYQRGSRRLPNRILAFIVVMFCASSFAIQEAHSSEDKPNVVLILMDNFGYGELGCYGGGITRGAPTPHIDKLTTQGLSFTDAHSSASVCTPARIADFGWGESAFKVR